MKKVLLGLIIVIMAAGCCHSRTVSTNTRNISVSGPTVSRSIALRGTITEIEASRVDVVYTPGAQTSATLYLPQDAEQYIVAEQDGDEFKVYIVNGVSLDYNNATPAKVVITAPAIDEISANLSAKVTVNGALNQNKLSIETSTSASVVATQSINVRKLTLEASTSANIKLTAVTTQQLKAESSTGADITVAGTAGTVKFEASTGGDIKAANLEINTGTADASTGSTITCRKQKLTKSESSTGGRIRDAR